MCKIFKSCNLLQTIYIYNILHPLCGILTTPGSCCGEPIIWLSYPESAPFSFPGEKAEVAMAVLPLLLQGKSGKCKHIDFVEFISVSIISFSRTFISGHDVSLKQMFASALSKFRKGRNKDFMRCKFVHIAYFVHEELYTSSLQNIIDNFLHYYFHREKQVVKKNSRKKRNGFPLPDLQRKSGKS